MVILELVLGISWQLVNVLWSGSPSSNNFNIAGIVDSSSEKFYCVRKFINIVLKFFTIFENLSKKI